MHSTSRNASAAETDGSGLGRGQIDAVPDGFDRLGIPIKVCADCGSGSVLQRGALAA